MTQFEQLIEKRDKTTDEKEKITLQRFIGEQLILSKYELCLKIKLNTRTPLKVFKAFYGLKGRSAKECYNEFVDIFNKHSGQKTEKVA